MGYAYQEYPKWVSRDGTEVIVNSREEEDLFMADGKPTDTTKPEKRAYKKRADA